MRVFIIGASGLVGANCLSVFKENQQDVIGSHLNFTTADTVYFNANDLDNVLNYDIEAFQPDIIIHCGALTNVDYCEVNPEQSFANTVVSTANIIALAKKFRCKLIYVSTDYVFNGNDGPYAEEAIPEPINIYGHHKWEAEKLVQSELQEYIIVRVTNVYGNEVRNKNFISRILQSIQYNQPVNLTLPSDQYATPINASDIAKAVFILAGNRSRGVYHLGSTDYYSRGQLVKKLLEYFPMYTQFTIKLVPTHELKQPAKRPLRGGLLSYKFLEENPDFSFSNVDRYLNEVIKHP